MIAVHLSRKTRSNDQAVRRKYAGQNDRRELFGYPILESSIYDITVFRETVYFCAFLEFMAPNAILGG